MQNKKPIDIRKIFEKVLGEQMDDFVLPSPSFAVMKCEIIAFDANNKSMTVKIPVLAEWLNPYGVMQGGMVDAAIDNASGPLSMLVAPVSMTRTMETKFLTAISIDVAYIYVTAIVIEEKKKRLTFAVKVEDVDGKVYATSKVVNFIIG